MKSEEEETVLFAEALLALVERIEKAMRPLGRERYGPDHDRVRLLYANLVRTAPATRWSGRGGRYCMIFSASFCSRLGL